MKGVAQTWVNNSPFAEGGGEFEVFENRLTARFVSKLIPFEYFIRAFNYTLMPNASPSAYADAVCNLLQKANVKDPLTGFCALYNGLPDDIQVHIMMDTDPKRLTKARVIELLKNIDSLKLQSTGKAKQNKIGQNGDTKEKPTNEPSNNGSSEAGKTKPLPFAQRHKLFSDPTKKTYWKCLLHRTDSHTNQECKGRNGVPNTDAVRAAISSAETASNK
eukprot:Nk52_evm1s992 gene=Nk52_evmTU1s992